DDRLHAGVGAPERDGKSGYKSKTELCFAFCRKSCDLFVKNVDRAGGKNACGQRKMGSNRRGVRDQSVERDERRNRGKDRQQRKEDDSSRNSKQPVVIHARIDAPEDIGPPRPGNLPRSQGVSSPARLLRSAQLSRNRLVVLELLSWPLDGIDPCRRMRVSDLARLIGRRIGGTVRLADPLVAPGLECSLGVFAAHSGNRS